MSTRYLGDEPCTSESQVVRYLTENYVDSDGDAMPRMIALDIVSAGREKIIAGISVFRSNVYYLGDEAMKNHGETYGDGDWTELPEPGEDEDEDETS